MSYVQLYEDFNIPKFKYTVLLRRVKRNLFNIQNIFYLLLNKTICSFTETPPVATSMRKPVQRSKT